MRVVFLVRSLNFGGVERQLVIPVIAIEGVEVPIHRDGHSWGDISRKAPAPNYLPCVTLA